MFSSKLLLRPSFLQLFRPAKPASSIRVFSDSTRIMSEFKLKGLKAVDLKPGEKKEVEVEGIEGGKVLLVNVKGKVTALGSKCTHFGAPMVKGILTEDGRLTCPWHGACFNATTGDIENAPALDALPLYKLSEKEGSVFVECEEATVKSSKRKPNIKCAATGDDQVIVVGGGSGALATIEALREGGFSGPITMISSEGYLPIDRTKLSKALIADASKLALRDEAWFKSGGIVTSKDEVKRVDFKSKMVFTNGRAAYKYSKLILATGGTPKSLPLPGFKTLGNIFLMRTVPDVQNILAAIGDKGKKIVVIGSSFIGMEVANAIAKDNTVCVVGMEKAPLERVMGEEVGKVFQKSLEKNGVKFYMNAGVEKASPSKKDSSKVGSIELKDGTSLEADLVILGTGVGPATTYLKENKDIELLKDGSLKTDEHFAVEGLEDVYAIGDIATYPYHGPGGDGAPTRVEHWNVAQNAGRCVAAKIIDPSSKAAPFIPIFWSALGAQLRYCGNTPNGWDDLVLKGEPGEGKFAAYYCKGETVVAVATMQTDPVMAQASELMRCGKMPSKSEIEKGVDILEIS